MRKLLFAVLFFLSAVCRISAETKVYYSEDLRFKGEIEFASEDDVHLVGFKHMAYLPSDQADFFVLSILVKFDDYSVARNFFETVVDTAGDSYTRFRIINKALNASEKVLEAESSKFINGRVYFETKTVEYGDGSESLFSFQ